MLGVVATGQLLVEVTFRSSRVSPLRSNRETISPTSPRATPSGLTIMKVRSIAMSAGAYLGRG